MFPLAKPDLSLTLAPVNQIYTDVNNIILPSLKFEGYLKITFPVLLDLIT